MKQIERVLNELDHGPATSDEIAEAVGLAIKTVSANLTDLSEMEMIEPCGTTRKSRQGRESTIWKLKEKHRAAKTA